MIRLFAQDLTSGTTAKRPIDLTCERIVSPPQNDINAHPKCRYVKMWSNEDRRIVSVQKVAPNREVVKSQKKLKWRCGQNSRRSHNTAVGGSAGGL